jgi:iron complex transport system ATP-binding protein
VLLARAVAQGTPLLLADEPVAGLDPAHRLSAMELMGELAREGRGVLVSIHDLPLAARHCTRLAVLGGGSLVADGPPEAVLTPELLRRSFGLDARIVPTPRGPLIDVLGAA